MTVSSEEVELWSESESSSGKLGSQPGFDTFVEFLFDEASLLARVLFVNLSVDFFKHLVGFSRSWERLTSALIISKS